MTARQPAESPSAILQVSAGAASQSAAFTWPAGVLKAHAGGPEALRAAAKSAGVLMAGLRSAGSCRRPAKNVAPAGWLVAAASSTGTAAKDSATPGWPSWAGALPAVANPERELGAAAAARAADPVPWDSTLSGRPEALGRGALAALAPAAAARPRAGGASGWLPLASATEPAVLSSAAGLSRSPIGGASDRERPQAVPRAEGLGS